MNKNDIKNYMYDLTQDERRDLVKDFSEVVNEEFKDESLDTLLIKCSFQDAANRLSRYLLEAELSDIQQDLDDETYNLLFKTREFECLSDDVKDVMYNIGYITPDDLDNLEESMIENIDQLYSVVRDCKNNIKQELDRNYFER